MNYFNFQNILQISPIKFMLFCHKFLCWEEKEKEFKLQSKVQPNEICALNNVHVRAINMKSHSSVAR